MISNTYPMAYTEVLTILKYYLKKEEYDKIPKEKIEFFEKNSDKDYVYEIDKEKPFEKQKVSQKANSIIVSLYRDYFTTDEEKRILNQILVLNDLNAKKIEKYERRISQNTNNSLENVIKKDSNSLKSKEENLALVEVKKESFWNKIINKINNFLKKNTNNLT